MESVRPRLLGLAISAYDVRCMRELREQKAREAVYPMADAILRAIEHWLKSGEDAVQVSSSTPSGAEAVADREHGSEFSHVKDWVLCGFTSDFEVMYKGGKAWSKPLGEVLQVELQKAGFRAVVRAGEDVPWTCSVKVTDNLC